MLWHQTQDLGCQCVPHSCHCVANLVCMTSLQCVTKSIFHSNICKVHHTANAIKGTPMKMSFNNQNGFAVTILQTCLLFITPNSKGNAIFPACISGQPGQMQIIYPAVIWWKAFSFLTSLKKSFNGIPSFMTSFSFKMCCIVRDLRTWERKGNPFP